MKWSLAALLFVIPLISQSLACYQGCAVELNGAVFFVAPNGTVLDGYKVSPVSVAAGPNLTFAFSTKKAIYVYHNVLTGFPANVEIGFLELSPVDSLAVGRGIVVGYDSTWGYLVAFDLHGTVLWKKKLVADWLGLSYLFYRDGKIYFVDVPDNALLALSPEGEVLDVHPAKGLISADVCGDLIALRTTNEVEVVGSWSKEIPLFTMKKTLAVAFSPDCKKLAVYYYGILEGPGMKVFDASSGNVLADYNLPLKVKALGWLNSTTLLVSTEVGKIYRIVINK